MFQIATGYLGWTPDVALNTPICQIELALQGRVEWVKKTNPFGSGETKPKPQGDVGEQLKKAFRCRGTVQ